MTVGLVVVPILVGVLIGVLVWAWFIRPLQIRDYERRRRALGLPPKHRLPEDH